MPPSKRIEAYVKAEQFKVVGATDRVLSLPVPSAATPAIGTHFGETSLPTNAGEKATVQPAISALIPNLNTELQKANSPLRLMDTYAKVSFNNRKPDIVVYPAAQVTNPNHLPGEYFIVCVGDVKGRRADANFTNEELGELEAFLSELLELFANRAFVLGFLTDGHYVLFMRLTRTPRTLIVSPALPFLKEDRTDGDGARYLMSLLCAAPAALGASVAPIIIGQETLTISKCLGSGSSAVVWQVRERCSRFLSFFFFFCI